MTPKTIGKSTCGQKMNYNCRCAIPSVTPVRELSPIDVFLARDAPLSTPLSRTTDNKGWAKLVSAVANNYQPAQQMIPLSLRVYTLRNLERLRSRSLATGK
jgi:hypothetical protein